MMARFVVPFLLLGLGGSSASVPNPPSLFLRGDTRACHGFLKLKHQHLLWKSSFSTCDSTFRVAGQQDGLWTLELTGRPGARAHQCSVKAITLKRTGPDSAYPIWQAAGYSTLDASQTKPPVPLLACELQ